MTKFALSTRAPRMASTALPEYPFDTRVQTLQDPAADAVSKSLAFEHILDQYGPEMMAITRRVCASAIDAEDAFQTGCLDAWRGIGTKFNPTSAESLPGWLSTIAHHKAVDMVNGNIKRENSTLPLETNDPGNPDAAKFIASADKTAHDVVVAKETFATVGNTLSKGDFGIVVKLMSGYRPEDIAAEEGIKKGAMRVRVHRARSKVQAVLSEQQAA